MPRWTPAIVLALAAPLHAQIVSNIIPDGLGVNIHFTDPKPGEMKQIADAGFKFIRMDFDWNRIEAEKGKYDFAPYDGLVKACEEHGIRILFILDYVNRHYDDARSPDTDEGRAAFARWAAASVQHFRGRKILWEMYNEPNIHPFWRPRVNHDDYVKLALAVGKAIREVAPEETYVGPASAGIELEFLETCFKGGLLEYFDAITVHPYRQQDPETVAADYRKLRMLIRKYAPKDKQIPIFSGEWGYSSVWSAYDADRHGKMLPRQWLTNIANDVNLSIWYDWHDDGPDPKEPEHHFGTVKLDYTPKPAYLAAKALTTELAGYSFNKRLMLDNSDDWLLLFSDARGDLKLVAWTTGDAHEVRLGFDPGRFEVVDHLGQALPQIASAQIGPTVKLTDAPIYLHPLSRNEALHRAWRWDRAPLEVVVPGPSHVEVPLGASDDRGEKHRMVARVDVGREPEPVQLRLPLDYAGLRQRVVQRTFVIVSNPLRLTFLPGGLLRIETGEPERFDSVLRAGASSPLAVRSEHAVSQLIVDLPPSAKPGEQLELLDDRQRPLVRARLPRQQAIPLQLTDYELVPEGDAKVASTQSFASHDSPDGFPLKQTDSIRIDYSFDAGWKFICLKPRTEALQKIDGKPEKLGLWVKGDNSGNIPRLRITDSTGQTFQPDGPRLSFSDWRYVEFPLTGDKSGHWGGANDGEMHYPIKFETLFLLDSGKGDKTQGRVFINSPTLIYAE